MCLFFFYCTQSETSSQLATSTPTKKLKLLVERIPTPPSKLPTTKSSQETSAKLLQTTEAQEVTTPEKSGSGQSKESQIHQNLRDSVESVDSPVFEKEGRVGRGTKKEVSVRSSPRAHLKRGRQVESSEGGKEGETCPEGKGSEKSQIVSKKEPSKPKARKAIKYLDDSEEETEFTGGSKKEQAVLTASGTSGKSLSLASPSKKAAASPCKQKTPEREGYLVKQAGLTFDKEKSASPVKTPRKMADISRTGLTTPVVKLKPVSSPVKLVSKSSPKPVTPASKVVSSSVKPVSTPGTTPSAQPKLSRGSSYRNYMNRSGPKAPGSKVVPDGEENCFEGLTFVITGVLDSLEREAAADIVKRLVCHFLICTIE